MFQGMFRKRGRPPEPLPIGRYYKSSDEESLPVPVHQLFGSAETVPLPSVTELEPSMVAQQERNEGNNELVQPSLSQSSQHVDNIESSQERRLAYNPRQVMSPNQAIPIQSQEADMFNVPGLPFSQTQRMKSSVKQVHVSIVSFVDLKVWC